MHKLLKIFVVVFAVLFTKISTAGVWDSDNNYWNDNWEVKYQQWAATEWKEDFFLNKVTRPAYYGIPHDCADAVYLMRAVFSYENKLPFKIHYLNKKK